MSFTLSLPEHYTRKRWALRHLKLLLVGSSGLVQLQQHMALQYQQQLYAQCCLSLQGKTTLCQCLLSVPGSALKLHDGTATSHQQFLDDPDSLCTTVAWEDAADKVRWIYKVQDTPGMLCSS